MLYTYFISATIRTQNLCVPSSVLKIFLYSNRLGLIMAMTIQGNLPSLLFLILFILVLSIIFKYLHDKFSKNPKSVAFAATIPGPPSLPLLGNGLDFFIAGPSELLDK